MTKEINIVDDKERTFIRSVDDATKAGLLMALREICERKNFPNNLQNIHTPYSLCHEQIGMLEKYSSIFDKDFVVFNLEYIEILIYYFGIKKERIWFVIDCKQKAAILNHPRYKGVNVEIVSFDKEGIKNMKPFNGKKFDYVLINPPYETKKDDKYETTQSIWHFFVEKSIDLCKENGIACFIHPSGWRSEGKMFKKIAEKLKSKQIHYLEIHSKPDGFKTFGAITRYDWYVLQNTSNYEKTTIKDQKGNISKSDIKNLPFIPNYDIDRIFSMIAKNDEEKVKIICDNEYAHRLDHISKLQSNIYQYPIVYSTPADKPTIWYSSRKAGHFGISKIILNPRNPVSFYVDEKGEYGMSEFCLGIVGDKEYLDMVSTVLKNQKTNGFADFMEACHFTDLVFNKESIGRLKKDFWKEFI